MAVPTVTVRVPCRLRVSPESVLAADDLVTAFAAATNRAVDRATREVVRPRGAVPALAARQPEFRWSGAALDRVPAAGRRALEERLRRAVRDAVSNALARSTAEEDSDGGIAARRPGERLDRFRADRLLRQYRMPSYNGEGGDTTITFLDDEVVTPVTHRWRVEAPRSAAEIRALIEEAVRQFGPLPAGVPRGIIAKEIVEGHPRWTVVIFSTPRTVLPIGMFGDYRPHGTDGRYELVDVEPVPVPGTAERRAVSDRAGLIAVVDELMGAGIQADYERLRPRDANVQSEVEYQVQIGRAVDDEVARRVDAVLAGANGAAPTGVIIVRLGNVFSILMTTAADDPHLHWTGLANLLPITWEVPVRRGDEGEGGPGGGEGQGRTGTGTGGGGEGGEGGPGGAGSPGEGGGTGAGTGTGGGRRRRGGFVFDPTQPTSPGDEEGSRFPVRHRGGRGPECEAFQGEPTVDELGLDGDLLRRLIDEIAYRLQIRPCYYAANFCLVAAAALKVRAADIGVYAGSSDHEAFTQPVRDGTGELGVLRIHPTAAPAIQFLRHLAGVVPRLHGLALAVMRLYEKPDNWSKVDSGWIDSPASWNLHFLEELTSPMEAAVAEIFVVGSQAMLLQLLLASRRGIEQRLANFERYAPIFERLMVSQLSDYAELQRLRDRLRHHEAARWVRTATDRAGGDVTATLAATNPATAWFTAARSLSSVFLASDATISPGAAGAIVEANGVARIRDSHGVLWTAGDIEQALALQRGEAEGIDPLVKQMSDIPDVLERFRGDRSAIRSTLRSVLGEMRTNNAEMLSKTRNDKWFAFGASRIAENIPTATVPNSRYALQGIHLQVHQQIGEFFIGDSYYAAGIDHLFGSAEGKEALTAFGLLVGIVILCVLCPPLGFAVGVAVAAVDVARAHERSRLFGSLIDPELVLTRTEVEIELFAAYFGLALSLIPEAGTAIGAVRRGVRAGIRAGLRGGVRAGLRVGSRAAGRYVVRRLVRQVVQALSRDLLQEFVTQILITEVMQQVISRAMEPVLSYLERESMIRGSVGGPEGAAFVLMVLDSERRTTRTTPTVRALGGVR